LIPLLALGLLLAVAPPPKGVPDAGPWPATDGGGDGGAPFIPAATEPPPTSCDQATEAAKTVARMRAAALKQKELAGGLDGGALDEPQVAEFIALTTAYQQESQEFRQEVHLLVEKKFDERRAQLSESFERAIRDLEVGERSGRLGAIAVFEAFLQRYPNDPTYSADASFRLAELYYEKGQDDYNLAMDRYQQRVKEFQAGTLKEEPHQPSYDFKQAVALYQHMLDTWPDYRYADAVSYLLGYCEEQQGNHEEADRAFAYLIGHFPNSRFVPEAWLRQGEYQFDAVQDPIASLRKAVIAYKHVLEFPDQPLYDKAMYKLGWAYYRLDEFQLAVEAFARLLDYYRKGAGGEKTNDLENEALQYAAISLADERWGGVERARAFFRAYGGRPYERDIFKRMGDIFYDQTKAEAAVAAYKRAIELDPLHADAPLIQAKIVQTWERDRAFDKQTAERDRLVLAYGKGSPWYQANRDNAEALLTVRDLTEQALRDAAIYHLQQALAYQRDKKVELAFTEFKTAATAFGEYLDRYPHAKDVYELTYYYADALYNSLQFENAGKQYQLVRDMAIDHAHQHEAAHDAVLSYQNEIDRQLAQKQLPLRPVLKSTDRKDVVPVAEPLPALYLEFVRSSDAFVDLYPSDPLAPAIAYKAAEIYYVFNEFNEARCRFKDVIVRYPRSDVAQFAANLTIETYLATKDWTHVTEATAELLEHSGGVVQKGSELEKTLVKFQLAGIFKLAQQEMDAGHYERAAALFLELVKKNPQHEFADKALNNAAVCYEKTRRFDSAMRTYERIFSEYPKSTLADQALFRVASDAEQSYDFDKAVARYQVLVDKYPNSKNRAGALYNAARLLEGLQRYPEAARTYRRYAELFPKEPDAPQNLFRAALVFEKQKDYPSAIRAFEEFNKKFDHDRAQAELTVQSRLKMALAYGAMGDEQRRVAMLKETVKTYDRLHLSPDKVLAADAAAEAQFDLLEDQFKAYDRMKIQGSKNVLARSFKDKTEAAKKLRNEYAEIPRFKRPEWTLAAFYRRASVLEHFANSIYDAPVPPEIKRLGDEAVGVYQDALAQRATALEAQAADDYVKTLEEARKLHIVNVWTKKTLEALSRYRPKDYPTLKEAREQFAFDVLSPQPLASSQGFAPPASQQAKVSGGSK
jgi:cellulose synthase operon protein C